MIFTLILNKVVLLEFLETCLNYYLKKILKSSVSASDEITEWSALVKCFSLWI